MYFYYLVYQKYYLYELNSFICSYSWNISSCYSIKPLAGTKKNLEDLKPKPIRARPVPRSHYNGPYWPELPSKTDRQQPKRAAKNEGSAQSGLASRIWNKAVDPILHPNDKSDDEKGKNCSAEAGCKCNDCWASAVTRGRPDAITRRRTWESWCPIDGIVSGVFASRIIKSCLVLNGRPVSAPEYKPNDETLFDVHSTVILKYQKSTTRWSECQSSLKPNQQRLLVSQSRLELMRPHQWIINHRRWYLLLRL